MMFFIIGIAYKSEYQELNTLENKTIEDIIRLAEEKRAERGGFDNKIYLEKVIER